MCASVVAVCKRCPECNRIATCEKEMVKLWEFLCSASLCNVVQSEQLTWTLVRSCDLLGSEA